jgi:NADPH-dependent 2,4-dienoyl-CoA reductase/sulfur reductase-like enzyme
MHYVVVGNGVAGMEAALALRSRESGARITIVSEEYDHFFSRPALMYIFAGQTTLKDTEPYDRGLYDRMGFERVRQRVAAVAPGSKDLILENGSRLAYDRLLLTLGSRGRPAPWPGSEGPGVRCFVTLRDVEALDGQAKRGGRAVVIGGGLIGVEAAEILHNRGLHVTFVIRDSWYFPLALDAAESALVSEHMRHEGIDVRTGAKVQEIVRGEGGGPRAVRLESGEDLACELVVVAIGVVPNTKCLEGSGILLGKGGAIEVDDSLKASVPDVYAAGDCANVTWADGTRRPEQLWYTARDQGRVAARAMLGDEVTYRRGAWYNSAKFFDIEWTTAGWVPTSLNWDDTPLAPGLEIRSWFQRIPGQFVSQRIVVKGDRVVGFNMLGSRWDHEPFLQWIQERRSLAFVLQHLSEAQFDEEFMPKFRILPEARLG